jgi:hypothetical protein
VLEAYFQQPGMKRNADGYAKAAKHFRLSAKQVKTWLPKTRTNRRGRLPDVEPELGDVGLNWNFPFAKSLNADDEGPLKG